MPNPHGLTSTLTILDETTRPTPTPGGWHKIQYKHGLASAAGGVLSPPGHTRGGGRAHAREAGLPVLGLVPPETVAVSRRIALAAARRRLERPVAARPRSSWSREPWHWAPRTDFARVRIDYGVRKAAVQRVENSRRPRVGGQSLHERLSEDLVQAAVIRSVGGGPAMEPGTLRDPERLIAFTEAQGIPVEPWQAEVIRGWFR